MEIEWLPTHKCEALLRSGVAGRVAVCAPDGPHMVPVNYSVVDESVVIRTTPYSKLATYAPGAMVAFEVDQFDYEHHRGWSVVARGRAHEVSDLRELEHILGRWDPRPWADGHRDFYLKFDWTEISGRRLGSGWSIEENLAVNRVAPWERNHPGQPRPATLEQS